MSDKTYNGWTNYETWAVNLWIDNDPGTQDQAAEMTNAIKDQADEATENDERINDVWTNDQWARYTLADRLKEWVINDMIPDLGASLAADLLGAALSEVNWDEIANNMLNQ